MTCRWSSLPDTGRALLNLLSAAAPLVLLALNVACFVLYWMAYTFYMLRGALTARRAIPCLIIVKPAMQCVGQQCRMCMLPCGVAGCSAISKRGRGRKRHDSSSSALPHPLAPAQPSTT